MKLKTDSNKISSPIELPEKNVIEESIHATENLHREMSEWRDEHDQWLQRYSFMATRA